MRFKHSKIYFVISSLFIGVLLIGTINFGLSFFFNSKFNKSITIENNFAKTNEVDVRTFYRSNSVSLSIIKNNYSKISGTAWIKEIDNDSCTFVTNLHVLSSIIKFDKAKNQMFLDNSEFSEFNIKYFLEPSLGNDKIGIARINKSNLSINFNPNAIMLEREIPSYYQCQNSITKDGKVYIDNGYIDYVEFTYNIPSDPNKYEENLSFNTWLKSYDQSLKPTYSKFNSISDEDIYIAGWPLVDSGLSWIEKKINLSSTISKLTTTLKELEWNNWLRTRNNSNKIELDMINNKIELRNIAKQLIIKNLQLGKGSSGSMVVKRNKETNSIEVIGIWWGTYGSNNGAIDLLWTNNYNPYLNKDIPSGWENIIWQSYNVNS